MKQIIYNIDSFDPGTLYTEDIRTGENLSTELIINLSEEFTGYSYLLALQNNTDTVVTSAPLTPNENGQLIFPIPYVVLQHEGLLKIEVNAYETDGTTVTLAKSAIIYLSITAALTAGSEVIPTDYVPWYVLTAEKAAEAALDRIATGEDRAATGEDRTATGEDRQAVASALSTFSTVTLPSALQAITDEGGSQVGLVQAEGAEQVGAVEAKGTEQVGAVEAKGTEQVGVVGDEGDTQVLRVQALLQVTDSVTGKVYNFSITMASGVPSLNFVEVI